MTHNRFHFFQTSNCTVDTTPAQGRVGINSHDLPVNVAQTDAGKYHHLYMSAVAYNGVLTGGWPVGMFRFGAIISPSP